MEHPLGKKWVFVSTLIEVLDCKVYSIFHAKLM